MGTGQAAVRVRVRPQGSRSEPSERESLRQSGAESGCSEDLNHGPVSNRAQGPVRTGVSPVRKESAHREDQSQATQRASLTGQNRCTVRSRVRS